VADAPIERTRRDVVGEYLMTAYLIVVSLSRALFFTGVGIALFLVAFLGYFTVSFLFLGVGLALLAGLVVVMKTYWVALIVRSSVRKTD